MGLSTNSGEVLLRDPSQHGYFKGTEEWNQWLSGYDEAVEYVKEQNDPELLAEIARLESFFDLT